MATVGPAVLKAQNLNISPYLLIKTFRKPMILFSSLCLLLCYLCIFCLLILSETSTFKVKLLSHEYHDPTFSNKYIYCAQDFSMNSVCALVFFVFLHSITFLKQVLSRSIANLFFRMTSICPCMHDLPPSILSC